MFNKGVDFLILITSFFHFWGVVPNSAIGVIITSTEIYLLSRTDVTCCDADSHFFPGIVENIINLR